MIRSVFCNHYNFPPLCLGLWAVVFTPLSEVFICCSNALTQWCRFVAVLGVFMRKPVCTIVQQFFEHIWLQGDYILGMSYKIIPDISRESWDKYWGFSIWTKLLNWFAFHYEWWQIQRLEVLWSPFFPWLQIHFQKSLTTFVGQFSFSSSALNPSHFFVS